MTSRRATRWWRRSQWSSSSSSSSSAWPLCLPGPCSFWATTRWWRGALKSLFFRPNLRNVQGRRISFQLCSNFPQWSHLVQTEESWWEDFSNNHHFSGKKNFYLILFLARQWDLEQIACQVRPKDLQLRFFPGNPMPLLLTLPQPPPQLLPFPPLEASHPENHQERGCPVIIFFNILQYSNNISQYSHSNGSLPSQKSYWAGLSRNHFFKYPTVFEQYPALFYILPRWKPHIPKSTPKSFF